MERKGVPRVVAVLAGLLERAAELGDSEGIRGSSAFHGPTKPGITVRRYADRIYRYAGCSPACFVVAYVYLDRLARRRLEAAAATAAAAPGMDSYSVHRLLISGVMVAAKFMDDIHYNNAYFARVGGIEVAEMNSLELEFLFGLQFDLNVTPALFNSYCATLEGEMMSVEASSSPVGFSPEEEHRSETQKKAAAAARSSVLTQRVVEITQ